MSHTVLLSSGVVKNLALFNTTVPSCEAYLMPLLSYLLEEFFKGDFVLSQFPMHLFDCGTVGEFARKFEKIIVPRMLWYSKGKNSGT